MEEIFQYDVSSTSYLFDQDLMMTNLKSALVQGLETKLTNDDERAPTMDSRLQTACVADVMPSIMRRRRQL